MSGVALSSPAPRSIARRLSFLDRYLTLWVEVPVLVGLVNVALRLRDRWFPGERSEISNVASRAVAVEGPAARRAR